LKWVVAALEVGDWRPYYHQEFEVTIAVSLARKPHLTDAHHAARSTYGAGLGAAWPEQMRHRHFRRFMLHRHNRMSAFNRPR
jgi:hypothetical protein